MALPTDTDVRKYYRVAMQRLDEARQILMNLELAAAAIYLTGYAVECMLKALVLSHTPRVARKRMLQSLKDDFGHNLRRLRAEIIARGVVPRPDIVRELLFVSSWSPELRYEPGPGDPREAARFLDAATAILAWADGRI